MATIITKNSQTASAVPSAASLSVGELAVNTADGKLYTEHTGGVVKEIIPSTVVDNGITTAKIADNAVTTNKLSNSGVTAGTYTTATVTVDAKGRVTSASSGSSGGVSSLNGQTGAIVDTNLYAIGSYVNGRPQNQSSYVVNSTIAGSSLFSTASGLAWDGSIWRVTINSGNPAEANARVLINTGTWRCVSPATFHNDFASAHTGLWVRIS